MDNRGKLNDRRSHAGILSKPVAFLEHSRFKVALNCSMEGSGSLITSMGIRLPVLDHH